MKESLARELTLPKAQQFLIEKVTKLLLEIVEDHSSGNVDEKYIAEKEKVAAKLVETMQKFEDENTDELKHLVFEGIVFDQMQSWTVSDECWRVYLIFSLRNANIW